MKLFYRGTTYEVKSPEITTREGEVIGKYRGAELHERIAIKH